jgi:hypothetical protein
MVDGVGVLNLLLLITAYYGTTVLRGAYGSYLGVTLHLHASVSILHDLHRLPPLFRLRRLFELNACVV